jgi:hypothetical protein
MSDIEQIQDEKIRSFTVDSLSKVPDFYQNQTTHIKETKKALEFSDTFLEVLQCSEYVHDVVRSAILLQDMTRFKMEYNEDQDCFIVVENLMHPLDVRITLLPLLGSVDKDTFDDIMRTIESSHGLNSPIPHVTPSLQDPVHIWILPFCNSLARAYANE